MQIGSPFPIQPQNLAPARLTGVGVRAEAQSRVSLAGAASDPLREPAVQREIQQLAAGDREVRAHEQAHVVAGGSLVTSGPSYSYQVGPDGRRYAIGGEVGIDTSPVRGDPEATLDKAQRIIAAALAPAQPSAQDLSVAAQAAQMANEARVEISGERARDAYIETASDPAQRSLISVRV